MNTTRHNLPIQSYPFIGRENRINEVRRLLSDTRLLTLTGCGGTGKTRLAIRAAEELLSDFSDGVYFVSLETITDPELVPSAIAQTLGLGEEAMRRLLDTITDYLREKQILLLLDNFEQLLPAASIVAQLLVECPRLKVMVTSRAALQVQAEQQYPVPPLTLPALKKLPPIQNLKRYEAVALFIQRAIAVKSDFSVTNDNAPALAEICHRLHGLPLAIELAAARVKLLPPHAILAGLKNRLKLLTGGARDRTSRQQTLRGAIAWSHDLLNEEEKILFRRLSVFAGGWTLEAAEVVTLSSSDHQPSAQRRSRSSKSSKHQASKKRASSPNIVDGLNLLVANSLLAQQETEAEARFRMLEPIREFAMEQLQESGEAEEMFAVHAAHFIQMAQGAEPLLNGPDQVHWLDRLEREHSNFRAALRWAFGRLSPLSPPKPGDDRERFALRLAASLGLFWQIRGYSREGKAWLEAALALPSAGSAGERAECLLKAANLYRALGDKSNAETSYEKSRGLFGHVGDRRRAAEAVHGLGSVAWSRGDYSGARSLFQESLAVQEELGDRRGVAASFYGLGNVAYAEGKYATARSMYEASNAVFREVGELRGVASSLHNLASLAHCQSDYSNARSLFEQSLAVQRVLKDRHDIALTLNNLGVVVYSLGDYSTAASLFGESLAIQWGLGDRRGRANSLDAMGVLAHVQRDFSTACSFYEESLAIREELGDQHGIAESLSNLALAAHSRGNFAVARSLFEECLRVQRDLSDLKGIARSLSDAAVTAEALRDRASARTMYTESLKIRKVLNDRVGVARSLAAIASLAAADGQWWDACCMLGGAVQLRLSSGAALAPTEQAEYKSLFSRVRDALGDAAVNTAWNTGHAMSLDETVDYVLRLEMEMGEKSKREP